MPEVQSPDGILMHKILYLLAAALVTLLLQLAPGLLGPSGIMLNLLAPLPVAFLCMLQGPAAGGAAVLLTALFVMPVTGPLGSATYLLQFGLGSLLLPLLLRRNWPWDRAVAFTLLVVVATAGIAVGGYLLASGESVSESVAGYIDAEIRRTLETASVPGDADPDQANLAAMVEQTARLFTRIYPGLAVAVTGAVLLVTLLLLARFARGRYEVAGTPFPLWKVPEQLVWLLIAAGFGSLASGWVQSVAWNLLVIVVPIYFLQGLAVVSYFFRLRGFSPLMRGVGYLLLTVVNPFQLLVAGIGVFDLWVDFRKPRIKKT